jgi:hypothetical protein
MISGHSVELAPRPKYRQAAVDIGEASPIPSRNPHMDY